MKAIIIDDNVEFAQEIVRSLGTEHASLLFKNKQEELSTDVLSTFDKIINTMQSERDDAINKESKIVLLINAQMKLKGCHRQDAIGIDLLKHLRLSTEIGELRKLPVILYSFFDLIDHLKSNVSNTILLSKGTHLQRLPFREWKSLVQNINGLKDIHDIDVYLKQDLSKVFTFFDPFNKHSIANLWGPCRLLTGYVNSDIEPKNRSYFKQTDAQMLPLPVKHFNEELRNNIGLKAFVHLYGHPFQITDKPKQHSENLKTVTVGKKILYVDDEHTKGWSDVLRLMLFHSKDKQGNQILNMNHWEQQQQNPNQTRWTLKDVKDNVCLDCFGNYHEARQHLSDGETKLKEERIMDYDLILLDLRLTTEDRWSSGLEPQSLSGAKLLKEIRGINPVIPIIIFTASNKAWNYHHLVTELGANDYWIKESPEFENDVEKATQSYRRLKTSIFKSLKQSEDFKYLWKKIRWLQRSKPNVINLLKKLSYFKYADEENKKECLPRTTSYDDRYQMILDHLRFAFKLLMRRELVYETRISSTPNFEEVIVNLGKVQELRLGVYTVRNAILKDKNYKGCTSFKQNLESLIFTLRGRSAHLRRDLKFEDAVVAFVLTFLLFEFPESPDAKLFSGEIGENIGDLKRAYLKCNVEDITQLPQRYKELIKSRFEEL